MNHHSRDIEFALQQQTILLSAAEAASTSLDAAFGGSSAAQALFDICTRASSPSPAAAAAEFRRSPVSFTSAALLGQLHAARRAVWNSGGVPAFASASHSDSTDSSTAAHVSSAGAAALSVRSAALFASSTHAAAASVCSAPIPAPDLDFVCSIGKKGNEDGEFNAPWGVAVDDEGCILVTEKIANRLQVLQHNEELGQWIFTKKSGLHAPRGVACVRGIVVVALTELHELLLKPDSSLISSKRDWVHLGSGLLNNPNGVDIDSDSNIWVADTGNR